MKNKGKKARELFLSGANCAQSVLGAYAEECGLDEETALRLASGFGAGMGRMREVCGAVSGMFMAFDLLRGYSDLTDKAAKDAHYARIQQLAQEFRQENGSIICRELLGLAPRQTTSPISEKRSDEYYKKRPCADLVALAATILETKLQQEKENIQKN